jgi:calcium-translocating P-type ATPase
MAHNQKTEDWHALTCEEVGNLLQTGNEGLTESEVIKRRKQTGINSLPEGKGISVLLIVWHQIKNPLISILLVAALVSLAIGDYKDAIFIFTVILLNSVLGAYQEFKAEKSAASLKTMLQIKARVWREGHLKTVDSKELVPGDLVFLESGYKVPADLHLIEAQNLQIDESFLTGESVAANKRLGEKLAANTPVSDRLNMAFAGSTVMSGRAKGRVVQTGLFTQVGKIARHLTESKSNLPPLVLRMNRFVKHIAYVILAISFVFAWVMRAQGAENEQIFFFVIALAVAAIPEGLPVGLTVALSIATKRMSDRQVIVRKLTAVESLGSCTVIASDKTGTLTVNEQTVRKVWLSHEKSWDISGEGYNGTGSLVPTPENDIDLEELLHVSALANEAELYEESGNWNFTGDAMDVALLSMVIKAGLASEKIRETLKLSAQIPYESELKFSAAFWKSGDKEFAGAKGALETVLPFCSYHLKNGIASELDKQAIQAEAEKMAEAGFRVLAFAGGAVSETEKQNALKDHKLSGLNFLGLVCFIDPLRPEAKLSVERCKEAGIKVIMITGDHPGTAANIASELGILNSKEQVISGRELSELMEQDSQAYHSKLSDKTVFARVSPEQKLQIVDSLIKNGEFVAVTGDGVNDAPALKRAHIGVAMGSGTDVAKETASMIILDDNFRSIVEGIEQGRFAFDNVRKVIYLLVSTGLAVVLLCVGAISLGMPLPLLPVQLLWLNLVTNGIQDVALAFEGGEPGAMKRPPRKTKEGIFNEKMITQTLVSGLLMGSLVLGLYIYLMNDEAVELPVAQNLVLLLMVFLQNVQVFNCRSERVSAFRVPISRNWLLIGGVILAQGIHILSMQLPFMQEILGVAPVPWKNWLQILMLALPLLFVMELYKFIRTKV